MGALISWDSWSDKIWNLTSSKIVVGLEKQPGKGKGEAKLIVNAEKKGTMVYNAKEEILKANMEQQVFP